LITSTDFVCLPYSPDLTQAGISYACRSLPHTYDRMGGSPFDRLRRIVTGIAVELAFRRYLARQEVPFDVKGATPFTEPDRYDVSLGGHRCDIKSFLISHREQIRSLHAAPAQLLEAPALVPLDQYVADGHSPSDLYLFAFLTGLVAAAPADIKKATDAKRPIHLIHAMPPSWVRPSAWAPLGPLVVKSECAEPLMVEVGGQNASRDFITKAIELPPHRRVEIDEDFHALAYVHADSKPGARLGIHSPRRRETYLIQPVEWGNIWVYGMRIYLTGWITREGFRQRASLVQEGSQVFQYDRTRTKNLAVPISDLRPLGDLLRRTRAWAESRSNAPGGSIV
jgi:hypothetical protein